MKKLLSIMFCLCAVMAVQAQVIKKGDAFWNGKVLYTVKEIRMGKIVYMQGVDASGNDYELTLEKEGKKAGDYKLIPSRQADDSPFRCQWNSKVSYIRKNGMNFLAVHNADVNLIVETLVLTPDNITNCQAQFEDTKDRPLSSIASTCLFNEELTTFLFTEEMKKYVKKFANKKNRTVIENTNMQLMKSELQERESCRDDNGF